MCDARITTKGDNNAAKTFRIATHPGQILFHEFLEPLGLDPSRTGKSTGHSFETG